MIKISGIATVLANGILVPVPNSIITFTCNKRDVLPIEVPTDDTGYFEVMITAEGEWQHDKIITSETITVTSG